MACKNFADSSSSGLAFGKQADCGEQQEQLQELRFTSSDLQFSADSTQSEEIRNDRNVPDLIRTATSVSGSVGYELSYETYDTFIEAALSTSGSLDGAGTAAINGVNKSYFTFEDNTTGNATFYRQFTDCEIDTMSFNIAQGEVLSGTMGIMGRASTSGTSSIDTDGYFPATTTPVYNAVEMVSSIKVDDVDIGEVQALTIDISNNKREQRAIGNVGLAGVGDGQFIVTGTMTIYFTDLTMYDKFLNDESFKFELLLDDNTGLITGNRIGIEMPKVKFGNVSWSIPGNNQDILLEADYQAIYDTGILGTLSMFTNDKIDV